MSVDTGKRTEEKTRGKSERGRKSNQEEEKAD